MKHNDYNAVFNFVVMRAECWGLYDELIMKNLAKCKVSSIDSKLHG